MNIKVKVRNGEVTRASYSSGDETVYESWSDPKYKHTLHSVRLMGQILPL